MANTLNTLLSYVWQNQENDRARAQNRADQAAMNTANVVSQQLAERRADQLRQQEMARQLGAAAVTTGAHMDWNSPEMAQQGELGALSQQADIARQQVGREFELQKLAELLQGKQNVANTAAGAKEYGANLGYQGRVEGAQIGAEASERREKTLADAMKYSADRRMSAMLQRPALSSFWKEKTYWDTGQGGQTLANLNTAAQHMERLRGAIAELKNSGAVHFNHLKNAYEYETGDPRILNYKTIAHVETREIAKFLNSSGALTDSEKESTNSLTNEDLPIEGQETVLRDLWHMATDKHEALMHQRNHMFEDPDQYQSWSPGAIEAAKNSGAKIDTTEGNGPRSASQSSGQPSAPARVKFRMPDGRTGTADPGDALPEGAKVY